MPPKRVGLLLANMVVRAPMWNRLREAAASLRREIRVYRLIQQHPRTPKAAKILVGAAVAYSLSPIDLIPDFIPVVGHLDDVIVVPALLWAAVRIIPKDVLQECRAIAGRESRVEGR